MVQRSWIISKSEFIASHIIFHVFYSFFFSMTQPGTLLRPFQAILGHSMPNRRLLTRMHPARPSKRSIPASKSLYNLIYYFISRTVTLEDTVNGGFLGFAKLQVSSPLRLPHTDVFFATAGFHLFCQTINYSCAIVAELIHWCLEWHSMTISIQKSCLTPIAPPLFAQKSPSYVWWGAPRSSLRWLICTATTRNLDNYYSFSRQTFNVASWLYPNSA